MKEAQEACRANTCITCGASPGVDCRHVGQVPNAGKRMRRDNMPYHHEARWRASKLYPFTITDV